MTARRALPDPDGNTEATRLQARSDAVMTAITATLTDHLPHDHPTQGAPAAPLPARPPVALARLRAQVRQRSAPSPRLPEEDPMTPDLPTCPREDCTFTGPHHDHDKRTGKVRDRSHNGVGGRCGGHWETASYTRCYAPRTPQPKPAAVVLPTVEEVTDIIKAGGFYSDTARAVLDLIAARLPVWKPVEPGTVVKAGTRVREIWSDGDATEYSAGADFTPSGSHVFFIDPRTVPAEPEDPRVAVVLDWYLSSEAPGTDTDARDLLARLDAVRAAA